MSEVLEEPMLAHGLVGQKSFTMKNSVKAFNILSDSLYMNKVLAVIRELSCNAADAQIEAGTTDVPFEIHLPDEIAPYFFIRDFGTGLDHEAVLNLYTTYFDSTKSDSADATGALGLGSKSPFAVVDDFTVVSYQEGKARTYFAYKNDEGFPCISFVSEDDAETESNGMKIQFAVRKDKFTDFRTNLPVALYHFTPKPAILNVPTSVKKEDILVCGKNWEVPVMPGHGQTGFFLGDKTFIVMAKISYPLDLSQLLHLLPEEEHYLLEVCNVPMRIYVENRSVDHTPSREHLQYNRKTIATVKKHLKQIYDEIFAKVREEFAQCKSETDVLSRCSYLSKITESNIRVDPWKSQLRVFGPKEFEKVSKIFQHFVEVGTCANKVNLHSLFSSAEKNRSHSAETVINLASSDFDNFNLDKVANIWGRIEAKTFDRFGSRIILTDEEIQAQVDANYMDAYGKRSSFAERQKIDLTIARGTIRGRKSHNKHTVKLTPKFKSVSDTGKEDKFLIDKHYTNIKVSLDQFFIKTILVVDDYPKDLSAIARAGYARMTTRDYTDYIVFSNIPRSGGRFDKEELQILEQTVRAIGKDLGVEVIRASEIVPPPIILAPEPRRPMDRQDYCAFNIIAYNNTTDKFKEVPADEMSDDFALSDFDDDSVVFLRRRYNDIYIFGDEDSPSMSGVNKEAKIGETVHKEFEELVRFLSVFAGKNIIEDKTVVVIKTKQQYQKALTKSKWKSFSSLVEQTLNGMSEQQIKEMFFTLALSKRNGIYEFLGMQEVYSLLDDPKQYDIRTKIVDEMTIVAGIFANWFANCETSSKKVDAVAEHQRNVLEKLEASKFKDFAEIAASFFIRNEALRDEHHMFNFFSSSKDGSHYSVRQLITENLALQKILLTVLGKKLVVHIKDFMLQCQELPRKYPMLRVFAAKLTQGESTFTAGNIARSKEILPILVDYVNTIEGAK